jgi:hypothetical protein
MRCVAPVDCGDERGGMGLGWRCRRWPVGETAKLATAVLNRRWAHQDVEQRQELKNSGCLFDFRRQAYVQVHRRGQAVYLKRWDEVTARSAGAVPAVRCKSTKLPCGSEPR